MLPRVIFFSGLLRLIATAVNVTICPNLRTAINFTVVAASLVSSTGNTFISGNLAISSSSTSLTGFNPTGAGVISGVTQLGNGVALQALQDVTLAYNDFKGAPVTALMTGIDLAGKTLGPGVYKFDSAAEINAASGILTLNGSGIYIFQIGSTLSTSINSEIRALNGAKASCIFWQVGSSATLGQQSRFVGNILAYASVVFMTGVTYTGSVYAQTTAVTFIADTIIGQPNCDWCQNITDAFQSQASSSMRQNISFVILTMFLVSFF